MDAFKGYIWQGWTKQEQIGNEVRNKEERRQRKQAQCTQEDQTAGYDREERWDVKEGKRRKCADEAGRTSTAQPRFVTNCVRILLKLVNMLAIEHLQQKNTVPSSSTPQADTSSRFTTYSYPHMAKNMLG